MNINSKKRGGFGLVEVVIAMALIAIISGGVYSGYMIMIRQTKDAEEKQITALIGKQVTEEIKLAAGKTIYDNLKSTEDSEENNKLNLTNVIQIKKGADNQFSGQLIFDKNGKNINEGDGEYKAEISISLKTTGHENEQNRKQISIDSIENDNIEKIYIVKQNGSIKLTKEVPTKFDDENNTDETEPMGIKINIDKDQNGSVSITDNQSQNQTFEKNKIKLDFKYYKSKVNIQVTNENETSLDLYILNSIYISENSVINRNVTVKNSNESKASVKEYYRSEEMGKIGKLFNINIKVLKKDDELKTFFESNFVQNINIKESENT